jgi:hypothetical protein
MLGSRIFEAIKCGRSGSPDISQCKVSVLVRTICRRPYNNHPIFGKQNGCSENIVHFNCKKTKS